MKIKNNLSAVTFLITLYFLSPKFINAQEFNSGLILGSAITHSQTPTGKRWEFNENIFSNYKAFIGYRSSIGLGIELRGGYAYPTSLYRGWEAGFNFNYPVLRSLRIKTGLNFHYNEDIGNNSKLYGKRISLFDFGFDYRIAKTLLMELGYSVPLVNQYAAFDDCDETCVNYEIYGIVSLNLILFFELKM